MCLLLNILYNANGFLQNETLLSMKLQMNYLQKDNWAHLLKCWYTINLAYVLHMQQIACLNKYWYVWVHTSAIACHSLTGLMRWKTWFVSLKLWFSIFNYVLFLLKFIFLFSKIRVHTVRENQDENSHLWLGEGKSGNVRECQGNFFERGGGLGFESDSMRLRVNPHSIVTWHDKNIQSNAPYR